MVALYLAHWPLVLQVPCLNSIPMAVWNPGGFGQSSFRPESFRPIFGVGRFGLGRWVVSAHFWDESFWP